MTEAEMLALHEVIRSVETEDEMEGVMKRIKVDIVDRKDTKYTWTPEQTKQAREWCRLHRDIAKNRDKMVNAACFGWGE